MGLNIVAVVQARVGSTRLPGKVLKEVAGKSLLAHLLETLALVPSLDEVIVATTEEPEDDLIAERFEKVYRGSQTDVLARTYGAAKGADVVVRITSDCPLIDPQLVELVIQAFLEAKVDAMSTGLERWLPRGMDVEVFSYQALERAYLEAKELDEREHVTLYFYRHPEKFRLGRFRYRLTVDTTEDLSLIAQLIKARGEDRSFGRLLQLLARHPDWAKLNGSIEQKQV
ncbi:MAG: glycosyltransferase family protein [Verrucomicrobia bacterium]|nr:glycosyltransferase family protein [Verrucomicrobiota bacterium]